MTASELIKELEEIVAKHGDLTIHSTACDHNVSKLVCYVDVGGRLWVYGIYA